MKALLQRVGRASVTVAGDEVAAIGAGLLVFVGVGPEDDAGTVEACAAKVRHLRIFPDRDGRMNLDVLESGGEVLVVSQFTLMASTRKGRRPSFAAAASPEVAEPLVRHFIDALAGLGLRVRAGSFGADMQVALVNDGPVTLWVET